MFSSASAVQLGNALLCLLDRRARAATVAVGDQHHERHRRERDQAEARFGHDHHDSREHDRQDRLQDEHQAVAQEEANGLQVDRRARHQLARLLAVEEAELELLQVAVEQLAQVVFDAEREPPGDHPPPVHESPAHQHDHRDGYGDQREFVAGARLRGGLVVRARADDLHYTSNQRRQRDRHHHREAGEGPGDDHAAPVGAQKSEESVEGRHSCTVNDYCRGVRERLSRRLALRCGHVLRATAPYANNTASRTGCGAVRYVPAPGRGAQHARFGVLAVRPIAQRPSLSTLSAAAGDRVRRV